MPKGVAFGNTTIPTPPVILTGLADLRALVLRNRGFLQHPDGWPMVDGERVLGQLAKQGGYGPLLECWEAARGQTVAIPTIIREKRQPVGHPVLFTGGARELGAFAHNENIVWTLDDLIIISSERSGLNHMTMNSYGGSGVYRKHTLGNLITVLAISAEGNEGDGIYLAASSGDSEIHIWDISPPASVRKESPRTVL
jgi:hypothetical protein